MGLPGFFALPVEWAIDARIDADWDSLDALEHTEDFHLPILLFHGEQDEVVPIETSEEFAAELPESVTYYARSQGRTTLKAGTSTRRCTTGGYARFLLQAIRA